MTKTTFGACLAALGFSLCFSLPGCAIDPMSPVPTGGAGPGTTMGGGTGEDGGTSVDLARRDSSSSVDFSSSADLSSGGTVDLAGPMDNPGPGPTQSCAYTANADGFFTLTSPYTDYIVRLPPGYNSAAPTPQRLVVAMHGCGDNAYDFADWAVVPSPLRASQSYIAISIGGRDGDCWDVPADSVAITAAITHVRSCFYVHQKKIVLAGYSSGGMLAYRMGMADANLYAGLLIQNSGLSYSIGTTNVGPILAGAAWKINIAHTARISDEYFDINYIRDDRDAMLAAQFPLQYRELAGMHPGDPDDWSLYLLPKMASWTAP